MDADIAAWQSSRARNETPLFDALENCLARLPDSLRETINAYYYEGRTGDEVATRLDVAPAAVRKRLQRARTLLKQCLEIQTRLPSPPRRRMNSELSSTDYTPASADERWIDAALSEHARLGKRWCRRGIDPAHSHRDGAPSRAIDRVCEAFPRSPQSRSSPPWPWPPSSPSPSFPCRTSPSTRPRGGPMICVSSCASPSPPARLSCPDPESPSPGRRGTPYRTGRTGHSDGIGPRRDRERRQQPSRTHHRIRPDLREPPAPHRPG
jgi:hypothetical protein